MKKKAHPLTEKYGKMVEKYPSQKARKKHEKAEGFRMERKEKAMGRRGASRRTVAQRG
jgi:hypothetical protein